MLFYYSLDGVVFSQPLKLFQSLYGKSPVVGRDPSIIYSKGVWYIAVTADLHDSRDFLIYYSTDLLSWKKKDICLNGNKSICSQYNKWADGDEPALYVWAPQWIVIDDELYLSVSIYLGADQIKAKKSHKFGIGLSKVIDLHDFKFSYPEKIKLSDGNAKHKIGIYSRIDAVMSKDKIKNRYIVICKRENFGVIDVFESESILGVYKLCGTIELHSGFEGSKRLDIEAPILYQTNDGVWIIAFDAYTDATGILYVSTKDFRSFDDVKRLKLGYKKIYRVRHGTIQRSNSHSINQKIRNSIFLLCNSRTEEREIK